MVSGRFLFDSDPGRYDLLPHLLGSVVQPGTSWVDEDLFRRLHLAIHELLVNVTRHAYRRCDGMVEMHVSLGPNSVLVSLFDGGRSFDGAPDFALPEEPACGGYGLPIIDAVADNVRYRRWGGENHWQLEFLRTGGPTT